MRDPLYLLRRKRLHKKDADASAATHSRVSGVARVLHMALRTAYKSSKNPGKPRKMGNWDFRIKWKTLPRILSAHMAQMMHLPTVFDEVSEEVRDLFPQEVFVNSELQMLRQYMEQHLHFLRLRSVKLSTFTGELQVQCHICLAGSSV